MEICIFETFEIVRISFSIEIGFSFHFIIEQNSFIRESG